MATFKFVFRPSRRDGRQQGSLFLRVIHERKSKTASVCCRLFPDEWDMAAQAIRYPACEPSRRDSLSVVEGKLSACRDKLNDVIGKLEKKGYYTASDIIGRYRCTKDAGMLLGYAASLAEDLRENEQYRTARAYGTVCRGLVAFNSGVDVPLVRITAGLIKRFETNLKEKGKQPNTISYYMRNLRAIYNKAVDAGRIPAGEKPFAGVFTGVEETKKRALVASEINRLRRIEFENLLQTHQPGTRKYRDIQNLYYAWRLFFFCLYAHGMCFVDLAHLKKAHLKDGVIRYYRKKTGKQIEVPVNEGMRKIIESFAAEMKDSSFLFPVAGNVGEAGKGRVLYETAMCTQNRRLKKLAELVGIERRISTHVARHTWATICKNELLPLSVISEGLGHSSEKMTRKYLASFDHSILGDAGKTVLSAISRLEGLIAASL